MTLNAVIALILRFFSPNSTDFQADYITLVEDRPIMSVNIVSQFPFHFWPNYDACEWSESGEKAAPRSGVFL